MEGRPAYSRGKKHKHSLFKTFMLFSKRCSTAFFNQENRGAYLMELALALEMQFLTKLLRLCRIKIQNWDLFRLKAMQFLRDMALFSPSE